MTIGHRVARLPIPLIVIYARLREDGWTDGAGDRIAYTIFTYRSCRGASSIADREQSDKTIKRRTACWAKSQSVGDTTPLRFCSL